MGLSRPVPGTHRHRSIARTQPNHAARLDARNLESLSIPTVHGLENRNSPLQSVLPVSAVTVDVMRQSRFRLDMLRFLTPDMQPYQS